MSLKLHLANIEEQFLILLFIGSVLKQNSEVIKVEGNFIFTIVYDLSLEVVQVYDVQILVIRIHFQSIDILDCFDSSLPMEMNSILLIIFSFLGLKFGFKPFPVSSHFLNQFIEQVVEKLQFLLRLFDLEMSCLPSVLNSIINTTISFLRETLQLNVNLFMIDWEHFTIHCFAEVKEYGQEWNFNYQQLLINLKYCVQLNH